MAKTTKTTKTTKTIAHDEAVKAVIAARARVTLRQVSDAFLASLSTNNLTWRAALSAYAVATHFPKHKHQVENVPGEANTSECDVCGMKPSEAEPHQEYIWGLEPTIAARNLEALVGQSPKPTAKDFEIINAIFRVVRDEQAKATDRKAHRAEVERGIAKLVPKSNKRDRKEILETLAWCSLFATPDQPGFFERYVPWNYRGHNIGDWESPFGFWRARDGINIAAQRHFFPQKQIEVVAAATAPRLLEEKKTARTTKLAFVHPILAAALGALSEKSRAKLAPPHAHAHAHAGGPPPSLDKKTLAKLAMTWLAYVANRAPKKERVLLKTLIRVEYRSDEYWVAYRVVAKSWADPFVGAALRFDGLRLRANPLVQLKTAVRKLARALGDDEAGVDFVAQLDADLLRAEVDEMFGRSLPAGARVVFRSPKAKVFIATLPKGKRYLFAGMLKGSLEWSEGGRDEVLAMVPDSLFSEAVAKVL